MGYDSGICDKFALCIGYGNSYDYCFEEIEEEHTEEFWNLPPEQSSPGEQHDAMNLETGVKEVDSTDVIINSGTYFYDVSGKIVTPPDDPCWPTDIDDIKYYENEDVEVSLTFNKQDEVTLELGENRLDLLRVGNNKYSGSNVSSDGFQNTITVVFYDWGFSYEGDGYYEPKDCYRIWDSTYVLNE